MVDIVANESRVNVTWAGQNGDLPDTVSSDSTDGDVRQWVTEAVRTGHVPGIPADAAADFRDFVVDRFAATDQRPFNLIQVRPKTPFGGLDDMAASLLKDAVRLAKMAGLTKEEFVITVSAAWAEP